MAFWSRVLYSYSPAHAFLTWTRSSVGSRSAMGAGRCQCSARAKVTPCWVVCGQGRTRAHVSTNLELLESRHTLSKCRPDALCKRIVVHLELCAPLVVGILVLGGGLAANVDARSWVSFSSDVHPSGIDEHGAVFGACSRHAHGWEDAFTM